MNLEPKSRNKAESKAYFPLFFNVHAGFLLAEMPKVEMHRRTKNESGRPV